MAKRWAIPQGCYGVMNYKRKHKGSRKKRINNFLSSWRGSKNAKHFYESRLKIKQNLNQITRGGR